MLHMLYMLKKADVTCFMQSRLVWIIVQLIMIEIGN